MTETKTTPFDGMAERWDARYREATGDYFGSDPSPVVREGVRYYRELCGGGPAIAVDLGSGDGRHAEYLATAGFTVTAVDVSAVGIAKTRERLQARGLTAELIVADLRAYAVPDGIDLLVASCVIHLLPSPADVLRTWQAKTRAGGIAVVSSRGPFPNDPPEFWLPEPGELKHIFAFCGWQILHASVIDSWTSERGIVRTTGVVARKPEL